MPDFEDEEYDAFGGGDGDDDDIDDGEADEDEDEDEDEDASEGDESEEEEEETEEGEKIAVEEGEAEGEVDEDLVAEPEEETEIEEIASQGEVDSDLAEVQRTIEQRKKMLSPDVVSTEPPKRLTKYELTALIGFRAQQLAEGAPPYIVVSEGMDPISIAIAEFDRDLIPLVIEKPYPANRIGRFKYETCKLSELIHAGVTMW